MSEPKQCGSIAGGVGELVPPHKKRKRRGVSGLLDSRARIAYCPLVRAIAGAQKEKGAPFGHEIFSL